MRTANPRQFEDQMARNVSADHPSTSIKERFRNVLGKTAGQNVLETFLKRSRTHSPKRSSRPMYIGRNGNVSIVDLDLRLI